MNAPLTPAVRAALESVQLDDKYTLETGRAWMSGIHALVRLPICLLYTSPSPRDS